MPCPYCNNEVHISLFIVCAYCHMMWTGIEFMGAVEGVRRQQEEATICMS